MRRMLRVTGVGCLYATPGPLGPLIGYWGPPACSGRCCCNRGTLSSLPLVRGGRALSDRRQCGTPEPLSPVDSGVGGCSWRHLIAVIAAGGSWPNRPQTRCRELLRDAEPPMAVAVLAGSRCTDIWWSTSRPLGLVDCGSGGCDWQ